MRAIRRSGGAEARDLPQKLYGHDAMWLPGSDPAGDGRLAHFTGCDRLGRSRSSDNPLSDRSLGV
jgi:hypothetical protein